MGIEDLIIWTMLNITIVVAFSVFLEIMSWGFISLADCIALDFDPSCYSVHENKPVEGVDDPMWWPHQDREKDGDG